MTSVVHLLHQCQNNGATPNLWVYPCRDKPWCPSTCLTQQLQYHISQRVSTTIYRMCQDISVGFPLFRELQREVK